MPHADAEVRRKYQQQYRERNQEVTRAYMKTWRTDNRDYRNSKERERAAATRERNRLNGHAHYHRCNEDVYHYLMYLAKYTRSRRKHKNEIDAAHLEVLWDEQLGRCALSGVAMTHSVGHSRVTPTNASVDRIDNNLGYLPGNVRLVCAIVNVMRREQTEAEFIRWCNLISGWQR